MADREISTRLNSCEDVDSWVKTFNRDLESNVQYAHNALFNTKQSFWDWRLSYGIAKVVEGSALYYLSFHPPFCRVNKALYHYRNLAELATDVMTLENFLTSSDCLLEDSGTGVSAQDIIAVAFALSRDKESFELFQEQKELMDLGLKHFHLDNYYQDSIKKLCTDYYDKGTIFGKELKLSFLKS